MPKNKKKYIDPTKIDSRSYLHTTNVEKGEKGYYKSKFTSFSLHRDLKDDLQSFSGTGAFLKQKNIQKGEGGRYKSIYKGINRNDEGQLTYDVSREGGLFGNTSRSRVISEKSAARKMKRFEKKYNRNIKKQERKAKKNTK